MKIRIILFLLFAFLYVSAAFAQKEPPQPTKDDSPPVGLPLPIDDYVPYLIPIGLVLGVCFLGHLENSKSESPADA